MSWGERSCIHLHDEAKQCKPEVGTCNVNCPLYVWDKKTSPDSRKEKEVVKDTSKDQKPSPNLFKIGGTLTFQNGERYKILNYDHLKGRLVAQRIKA